MTSQGMINHIALVLDASTSMGGLKEKLIKVADAQIAYLAQRSKDLDQETRITVYTFSDTVECAIYDKDVLRLPSIRPFYRVGGWTALIDATLKSQDDLAETPERYGDHAFLTFVLTDGEENYSKNRASTLSQRLATLPDHWTVAVMVPDQRGVFEAKRFGFPAANIAVWDATSERGVVEAGETIRQATDTYMTNRASGVRGTRSLFTMDAVAVNKKTISAADLTALSPDTYDIVPVVGEKMWIRDWVLQCGLKFRVGDVYYKLRKPEKVQGTKNVVIVEKKTQKAFSGPKVRQLLNLPDEEVRVKPDHNPLFDVYIQSRSVNRNVATGDVVMNFK